MINIIKQNPQSEWLDVIKGEIQFLSTSPVANVAFTSGDWQKCVGWKSDENAIKRTAL